MMNTQDTNKGMYTVETKSMLAKLMATEDIKVQHSSKYKTAKFDLKNRILHCPIWKDMSGDLYDLLMGHEISHALRTPLQGWHDSVEYAGGNKKASQKEQKAFKHFLNVVEDARIEKLLKRQYPGIRRPMALGYKELLAKDFFGLSAISDYNSLYLVDKLNLAAKLGASLNILFKKEEKPFYTALMATEVWEDVVDLAKKLYAYSKVEQKEGEKKKEELRRQYEEEESERQEQEDSEEGEDEDEDYEEEYEECEGEGDEGEEGDESEDEEEESEEGEQSDSEGEDSDDKDEEEKADDSTTEQGKDKGKKDEGVESDKKQSGKGAPDKGVDGESDDFTPQSRTDENFREKEHTLTDTANVESVYVNIPTPNLKDVLAPVNVVQTGLTSYYLRSKEKGYKMLQDFRRKNEDYITLLAKEFEMKKAARSYKMAKLSDSGDIDINKLANYKLEDTIFRKLLIVNKGKSHGLVLILDKSGSMCQHIEPAMEQILILALFCRKVNIPFVAYSFGNTSGRAHLHDFASRVKNGNLALKPFSENPGDLMMGELDFREMLNSKMPAAEFNQALINLLQVSHSLAGTEYPNSPPQHESMGCTPLNEALVVLRDVLRQFKMIHRLDIVNAVIVHDGDSDGNSIMYSTKDAPYAYHTYIDPIRQRLTLQDPKERLQMLVPKKSNGITTVLLKWIQMTTQCGVFGFYIAGETPRQIRSPLYKMYQNKEGVGLGEQLRYSRRYTPNSMEEGLLVQKLCKQVTEEKFLESYTDGYNRFFFIPGANQLKVESSALIENGKAWTPSRLLSAFKKVNKKKSVSRVLVSRFIDLIAVRG